MRLLALPLTRAIPGKRESLVYYLACLPPKPIPKVETTTSRYLKLATNKAIETWKSWSKAPESHWKFKVYSFGKKAQSRLEFEELALRSIDPSLGPRITSSDEGTGTLSVMDGKRVKIPVVHPESFQSFTSEPPLVNLKNHALHRAPKHKRLLYAYIFIAPLTTPFIFVPIIPNIPFFFCVWRAWSNYRASRAAKYLIDLLKSDTLVPTPSEELEIIYQRASQRVIPSPSSAEKHSDSSTSTSKFTSRADEILLGEDEVSRIIKSFELSKETGRGLLRAIKQARVRIHK